MIEKGPFGARYIARFILFLCSVGREFGKGSVDLINSVRRQKEFVLPKNSLFPHSSKLTPAFTYDAVLTPHLKATEEVDRCNNTRENAATR